MLYEILGFSDGEFPAGLGWHDKIIEGFPQVALWELSRRLGVPATAIAELLGLPEDQLNWRKRSQLLSPRISDQLFNIARAYQRLIVPLKDPVQAKAWLLSAQPALSGRFPLRLLVTHQGAHEVFVAIDAIKVLKTVVMNTEMADDDTDEDPAADGTTLERDEQADDEFTEIR